MRDALTIVNERMASLKTSPRAYLKGFPLKREPDSIDKQGRAVFEVTDPFEAGNKAFKHLHGDIPTPESDKRYDEVMMARYIEAEKAK